MQLCRLTPVFGEKVISIMGDKKTRKARIRVAAKDILFGHILKIRNRFAAEMRLGEVEKSERDETILEINRAIVEIEKKLKIEGWQTHIDLDIAQLEEKIKNPPAPKKRGRPKKESLQDLAEKGKAKLDGPKKKTKATKKKRTKK